MIKSLIDKIWGKKNSTLQTFPILFHDYNKSRLPGKSEYACYAPIKNIYFGHYGKAVACCYNREHVLGTYPQQSIHEIWTGEKAQELRAALKNYDFSHGCRYCLTQIKAGNIDAAKAKQYDEQHTNANGYPSVMEFELSNTCNLECVMCSGNFSSLIRKNREGKPPVESPYDDAFVEQLKPYIPFLQEVKFYGGEPFMIPIYYKIWELAVQLNPTICISIQTNATMLNSRIKDLLEAGNFHINISLDAVTREVYEAIRLNAKFDAVMENVNWFIDYCKRKNTFIGISACAMQQNWRDIPNILTFCTEKEVQLYLHTVFFPKECAIRNLSAMELTEISEFTSPFFTTMAVNSAIDKKNKLHFGDYIKQVNDWKAESIKHAEQIIISTPTELSEFVKHKMEQVLYQSLFDEQRRKNILQKLTLLISVIPKDFPFKESLKGFDFKDDYMVIDMLKHIENNTIETLLSNAPPANTES
jgi:MoaA/NifB/PqqE/SkfB family radical SAM enzyme